MSCRKGQAFFCPAPDLKEAGQLQRTIIGVNAYIDGQFVPSDIQIEEGQIVSVTPAPRLRNPQLFAFPGFTDVHVHFREPGFSYKETLFTGALEIGRAHV